METIKVVLVDDHLLFRMGVEMAIGRSSVPMQVVAQASCANDFFAQLPDIKADIVLLDILMPDVSGTEVAKQLRESNPDIKILVLSADNSRAAIGELMNIGIDGFINKSAPIEELLRAIEYVANGASYFGRDIAQLIHDVKVAQGKANYIFTPREMEIVKLCAEGLNAKDIAKKLNLSFKTVETHKNNIFKKLHINSNIELVRYAFLNGIIRF